MMPPSFFASGSPAGGQPLNSAHGMPFLTLAAGAGPSAGVPADAADLVGRYVLEPSCRQAPPNVDVDEVTQRCPSAREAALAIEGAARDARRLWVAALIWPLMAPPRWYPRHASPIPTYEHLIAGSGRTSIGMHRYRFVHRAMATPQTAPERLISTYISLVRGVKHAILLPPTPAGGALAERLSGEHCDDLESRRTSAQRPFHLRPPPALLEQVVELGGFWFDFGAPDGDGGDAVCLFIPAGWWHWILSDADWHVAWSGSFFPDADREAVRTTNGKAA